MIEIDLTAQLAQFALCAKFTAPNGTTAIFGPSGSGKTSIVRMICGLVKPDQGQIVVGDKIFFDSNRNINLPPRQRHVGYVGQDANLFPHYDVLRNITYSNWAGRRAGKINLEKVVQVLGIAHLLDRQTSGLSGGERQRVAIARALMADPSLLLLDEPLSALDEGIKQEILPFLEAIGREFKLPIFYISHSVDEVIQLADHLVILEDGAVKRSGKISDVLAEIDLHGTGSREAGVLISGICEGYDDRDHLARIRVEGQELLLSGCDVAKGTRVRLRVGSNDVAIATEKPRLISIQNMLSCEVISLHHEKMSHANVVLALGDQQLRSRVTLKSANELKLQPGSKCFALLKAVALEGQKA